MGTLERIERRLDTAISGFFARVFRSSVQPIEIAAALQRECENNAVILSRDRRQVPNLFHIELSPSDFARLNPWDSGLAPQLATSLQEYAHSQGYVFTGPVTIEFDKASDLVIGMFRVLSKSVAAVTGYASDTQVRKATAYLEVNGTRHPVGDAGLVVGRGSDADLRVNDPGISRRHVEFRAVDDQGERLVQATDLGSTNGMLVNGRHATAALLDDGAVVRIGSTSITVHVTDAHAGGSRTGARGV